MLKNQNKAIREVNLTSLEPYYDQLLDHGDVVSVARNECLNICCVLEDMGIPIQNLDVWQSLCFLNRHSGFMEYNTILNIAKSLQKYLHKSGRLGLHGRFQLKELSKAPDKNYEITPDQVISAVNHLIEKGRPQWAGYFLLAYFAYADIGELSQPIYVRYYGIEFQNRFMHFHSRVFHTAFKNVLKALDGQIWHPLSIDVTKNNFLEGLRERLIAFRFPNFGKFSDFGCFYVDYMQRNENKSLEEMAKIFGFASPLSVQLILDYELEANPLERSSATKGI